MVTGPELPGLNPREFQKRIYRFYRDHRRDLSWRDTSDPYRILVSEMMLQQTQVTRVQERYTGFVTSFADFASLHAAPVEELLRAWQGLGYTRRALALKKTASLIINEMNGILPDDEKSLYCTVSLKLMESIWQMTKTRAANCPNTIRNSPTGSILSAFA